MLLGLVSRLTWQKGIYLIIEQLFNICNQPVQLVVLGSGEAGLEDKLTEAEATNKGKIAFYRGYNENLAHEIYAGSDLFLMPSLFEPCGISQLIALRYGSLPIVREVGGLVDTVQPYNEYTKEGTGFSFKNYSADELYNTIKYALSFYNKEDYKLIVKQAMKQDFSWDKSCEEYIQLYKSLLK